MFYFTFFLFVGTVVTNESLRTVFNNDGSDLVMRENVRQVVHSSALPTSNYQQQVDHFGTHAGTFNQRYYVNDTWYKAGGPIFVYLGGEGPMELFLGEVQMFKWAEEFGAKYILLEHRYYGKSSPVQNYTTTNMQYLSSRQALADAAGFIKWYNSTKQATDKWMIFGCSYSGALSGWFRWLYPDIVVASFAPSGPVEAMTNFTGYIHQFGVTAGSECAAEFRKASDEVDMMLAGSGGMNNVSTLFQTCTPITKENLYYFKWQVAVTFAGEAQEDLPPNFPVAEICREMAGVMGTPAERMAKALQPYMGSCLQINETGFVESMKHVGVMANYDGGRAWFWQKCTEFGYFKPTYPGSSPFWGDLAVEHMVNWCSQVFGIPNMTPNTVKTNKYYGGKTGNHATKISITQGALDPWHLLGIDSSEGDIKSYLYEAGHCAPLHHTTDNDPPSLKRVRIEVTNNIRQYLNGQG